MGSRFRLPTKLPPLRGPWWWAYFALWLTLLALTLYGNALAISERNYEPPLSQRYGLAVGVRGEVWGPIGREAEAAGIRHGDRVVAVDGQRIGSEPFEIRRLIKERGMPPVVALTIQAPDGSRTVHRLTNSPTHMHEGEERVGLKYVHQLFLNSTVRVLTMLVVPLALATLLLVRRLRDPLAPWVSMAALLTALGLGPPLDTSAAGGDGVLGWALDIATPLAGWSQIAVLALFPDARFKPVWTWIVLIGAMPLMYWMRVSSTSVEYNTAALVGLSAAVAVVILRYRAMPPGIGRQQIRWALFGFAASLVMLALLIVGQQTLISNASIVVRAYGLIANNLLNGLSNTLLLAAMTLGLMRYRLYDADATISRSIAFGAVSLGLLVAFTVSEKLIETMGEQFFGARLGMFAGGIGAAMAAVLIVPMHHRVTRWAERRFRGALVHLRQDLPLLVGDMRETSPPSALADALLARVETGVRASYGSVVVGRKVLGAKGIERSAVRTWLRSTELSAMNTDRICIDRADSLFPVRVPLSADGSGLAGWLLLGPRPDGSLYGKEERDALWEVSEPVARALAVATDRQRREHRWRSELDGLRDGLRSVFFRLGMSDEAISVGGDGSSEMPKA